MGGGVVGRVPSSATGGGADRGGDGEPAKARVARWRRFHAAERRDKIGWAAGAGRGLGARAAAFESTASHDADPNRRRSATGPAANRRAGSRSRHERPPKPKAPARPTQSPASTNRGLWSPRAPERLLSLPAHLERAREGRRLEEVEDPDFADAHNVGLRQTKVPCGSTFGSDVKFDRHLLQLPILLVELDLDFEHSPSLFVRGPAAFNAPQHTPSTSNVQRRRQAVGLGSGTRPQRSSPRLRQRSPRHQRSAQLPAAMTSCTEAPKQRRCPGTLTNALTPEVDASGLQAALSTRGSASPQAALEQHTDQDLTPFRSTSSTAPQRRPARR